ncbi:hypothetical protein [Novosphingobium barchaimii]|nr:hypothetical protein [Novosphingobium barchaimii]
MMVIEEILEVVANLEKVLAQLDALKLELAAAHVQAGLDAVRGMLDMPQ